MFNEIVAIFQRGGCTISKNRNTHKGAAAPQHPADHGDRGVQGSSGSCSANGPRRCRIFAKYYCSVRVCAMGHTCGLTSGEDIPCPDLRLRSGRNTSFRWIFRSWKSSGPTFVSTCSVHRFYCRQTCIDQDLGPTSGYHRQWPKDGEEREIRSFYSSTSSRPQSGVHVAVKSVHKGYHPYSQHCPDQAGL